MKEGEKRIRGGGERMARRWKDRVMATGIVCAADTEAAMHAFIDEWLDYDDFEFILLGECEE